MFDLETAIATWQRSLEYNRAFLTPDLNELERHVRDQVAALVEQGECEEEAFRRALREMGGYGVVETEYRKVYWGKRRHRGELIRELIWRTCSPEGLRIPQHRRIGCWRGMLLLDRTLRVE